MGGRTARSPLRSIRRRPRGTVIEFKLAWLLQRHELFARAARPKDEFRLIGFDKTLHQVFGQRRIDQRSRMAGRGPREKTDDRFRIDAAEQEHEALSFGSDRFGEIKARSRTSSRVSQLSLRSS